MCRYDHGRWLILEPRRASALADQEARSRMSETGLSPQVGAFICAGRVIFMLVGINILADRLKVMHNLRLRLKKYEVSAQRVQCEWFML